MGRMAIGLVLVALCIGGCKRSSESPAAPPSLTIGYVGHDHQLALYVAALLGPDLGGADGPHLREVKPYEVYDLVDGDTAVARLRLLKVGGGSNMPAAMERGEIHIGLGSVAAVAKFADRGQPVKIIAPLQTDGDMLVMHHDSPITDWASFVAVARSEGPPLRIGYKAPVAVAKLVFIGALQAEGIRFSDKGRGSDTRVVLVNMGGEKKAIPLLASGEIDGFVMNQPTVAIAAHKGLGRVIATLRSLPPNGRWMNHPCCCVAATEQTLRQHPQAVKAFLTTIIMATRKMQSEPQVAVDCAVQWTRTPEAIEAVSVPTVTYVAEPTEQWLAGIRTWLQLMQGAGAFTGRYAQISAEAFLADVCDLALCRQALSEMPAALENAPHAQ